MTQAEYTSKIELTKEELAKLVLTKSEQAQIDYALPIGVANELRDWGMETSCFVWSYIDNAVFGLLLNLAELYLFKFHKE